MMKKTIILIAVIAVVVLAVATTAVVLATKEKPATSQTDEGTSLDEGTTVPVETGEVVTAEATSAETGKATDPTEDTVGEETIAETVPEEIDEILEDGVRIHRVLGKSYRITFDKTERVPYYDEEGNMLYGGEHEVYKDENESEFRYDEDGNFLGVTFNPESFDNSVSMEHKEDPSHPFTDEDAIAAAEALGRDQFGDLFDRLSCRSVSKGDGGERYVRFYQLLGEEKFVNGIRFHVTYLGDGTLLGFGMPNCYSLRDFDESLLLGVTRDSVMSYLDARTKELHGDRLIDWELSGDKVSLQRDEDGFFLSASVMANVHFDSGDWDDGGHTYRIRLPFEG